MTLMHNITKSVDYGIYVRSNMDDCIQQVMVRFMYVPSITAVGPTVTEKLKKKLNKVHGP